MPALGLGMIGNSDCCSCSLCPPCGNTTKPETVQWSLNATAAELATLASVNFWCAECFSIIGTRFVCTNTDPAIINPCTGLGSGGSCGTGVASTTKDFDTPITFHLEPDGDTFHSTEVVKLWHGTATITGCCGAGNCGSYEGQTVYGACSKECYHATQQDIINFPLLSGGSRYRISIITQSSAEAAPTIDDFHFPALKAAPFTVGPTTLGNPFIYTVPQLPSLYTPNTTVSCDPFHITDSWTTVGGILFTPIHATDTIDISSS